jgi:hypothetical protein
MGFSQSTITAVNPPVYTGFQVSLSWQTSSPAGTWFQIYIDAALAWWGQTTAARIALPNSGPVRVDIGTVLPGEEQTSFSGSLTPPPPNQASLSWLGGTFLDTDIAGFQIFGSDTAGGFGVNGFGSGPFGEIDLTEALADIIAYPSGVYTDGFGLGGFGGGGFGQSAGTYIWTSEPLTRGNWSYAVLPYDSAGNLGTAALTGVTITCPPLPPALFSDNTRLHYTYPVGYGGGGYGIGPFGGGNEVILSWNASPG